MRQNPKPTYKDLAQYNAECWRGIAHTSEWDAMMAELQEEFNRYQVQVDLMEQWRHRG